MGNIFDEWAPSYEQDVIESDQNQEYPFAGYEDVLNDIEQRVLKINAKKVLDIGIGSGTLAKRLADQGIKIIGVDGSSEMLDLTKEKIPNSTLYEYNIEEGLPEEVLNESFDAIVSTYTLHHLNDEKKVKFIERLFGLLNEGGKLLIGDISFNSRENEKSCRIDFEDIWDDEEYYLISDELIESFPQLTFEQKSFCAGVFEISN